MARFHGRSVAPTKKKQAAWASTEIRSRVLGAGATAQIGSVNQGFGFSDRVTIARMRGNIYVAMDPGAAGDTILVGCGLIIVNTNAFTTGGVTSMPTPLTDMDAAWMWHQLIPLGPTQAGTASETAISQNFRAEIDVKAMRKVTTEQSLAFVWEGQIDAGAPTYDALAAVRFMVLLS